MAYFEVDGASQKTGKPIKTKVVESMDESRARAYAESRGMTVISVTRTPELPPSEKQIAYAKDLGISVPRDANLKEVRDLISNAVDDDEPADEELMALADKLDIVFTKYSGVKLLHAQIWRELSHSAKTKAAWFTYCLYRDLLPKRSVPVATSYEHPIMQAISEKALQDPSLAESIDRYEGENLSFFGQRTSKNGKLQAGGSIRTKAYKTVSNFLRADPMLGLSAASERQQSSTLQSTTMQFSGPTRSSCKVASKSAGNGCLLTIISMVTVGSFSLAVGIRSIIYLLR